MWGWRSGEWARQVTVITSTLNTQRATEAETEKIKFYQILSIKSKFDEDGFFGFIMQLATEQRALTFLQENQPNDRKQIYDIF